MNESDRWKYDALTRQLERMRAMQYAYFNKFFTLLLVSGALIVAGLLQSHTLAWLLVSFLVITTGVQASFYLHFTDFARVHARALEERINRLLGERLLLGSELEREYFYPLETPKLSGFSPAASGTFFSFFTLHYCALWGLVLVWCWLRLHRALPAGEFVIYLAVFGGWTLVNAGWLLNYFQRGAAERKIAAMLREAYGEPAERG
jgi:hypothetical protein